ncbi:MAG: 6-phosphogluconolactonase [Actinobacteria bacterium HGW-Actinobacteria-4]|nr:MAG: 6-phosphogluconolactonase [Actinobacteria bacterium HGW-Actinobacteria-4]
MRRVVSYPDAQAVADATAARLLTVVADTLSQRPRVDVVLTGGTVGIKTLASIAASPLAGSIDWTAVHLWWGDERFVTSGDPDRNEGQAQGAALGALPIPEHNIHRMGAADRYATVEDAAHAYSDEIEREGSPEWDIVLLGIGPDGHVASLFPGHSAFGDSSALALAVHDSPKPPPTRVTLSLQTINRAHRVWVVAAGADKADAVRHCLAMTGDYPAGAVRGTDETLVLVDVAAIATG